MIKNYSPVSDSIFFKKNDPADKRLGEFATNLESYNVLTPGSFVIAGYPDDEGVKNNKGRKGAALGPDAIRTVFYKMTPSLNLKTPKIFDLGNLQASKIKDLSRCHIVAHEAVNTVLQKKAKVITFGGGHDYGFPDFSAFCDFAKSIKKKPFILNFDAHLDVRPDTHGINSGTPFYRLLSKHSNVDFFEIGIQDWCNSYEHFKWLNKKNGKVMTLDEINSSKLNLKSLVYKKIMKNFDKKKHLLAVSIDMDCFSSSFAPGVSQGFPLGLNAAEFFNLWTNVVADYSPVLVGIYEVNPLFDQDQRTSKLAAIFAHRLVFT